MALLQECEGKSGSKVERLRRVTLPGLGEGRVPAACGWRVDLSCVEAPGTTREVKERDTLYVSTGGKERAQNVGRPPKETLIINIIYSCFICRPLVSWTYETIFVSIIAIGPELFDFPLEKHLAKCTLFRLDTEDSNIQRVKTGRLVKYTFRQFLLLSSFQRK